MEIMSRLNARGILTCAHHYKIEKDSIELPFNHKACFCSEQDLTFAVLDGEYLERPYMRGCQNLYLPPRTTWTLTYPFVQVIIREARLQASRGAFPNRQAPAASLGG